jgi:hypothetical protein
MSLDRILEPAPERNAVWSAITKERAEGLHRGFNRYVFNKALYFPYGIIAETLAREKAPKVKYIGNLSHSTRLKIYNVLYCPMQYFHYICMVLAMLGTAKTYEANDTLGLVEDVGWVALNAVLALNIAYNRRMIRRRIVAATEKERTQDDRQQEERIDRERKERKRRKRERRGLRDKKRGK